MSECPHVHFCDPCAVSTEGVSVTAAVPFVGADGETTSVARPVVNTAVPRALVLAGLVRGRGVCADLCKGRVRVRARFRVRSRARVRGERGELKWVCGIILWYPLVNG